MAFLYNDEYMLDHYQSIYGKNREKLEGGGNGDPYLTGKLPDNRMALALVLRISPEVSANVNHMLTELAHVMAAEKGRADTGLYIYPSNDFHITVMDILRGEEGRQLPDNLKDYIDTIRACTDTIEPFRIRFKGITSSDSAMLVQGFYEEGLQQYRSDLRTALHEKGLVLEERYETFSCHITAARVIDRIADPVGYRLFIEKYTDTDFGTMTVNEAELVFHNWYDSIKTNRVYFSMKK